MAGGVGGGVSIIDVVSEYDGNMGLVCEDMVRWEGRTKSCLCEDSMVLDDLI